MSFFGKHSPLRVTCYDKPVQMEDMVSKEDSVLLQRFFSRYGQESFEEERLSLERLDSYLDIPLVQVVFTPCYEALRRVVELVDGDFIRVIGLTHGQDSKQQQPPVEVEGQMKCYEKLFTEEILLEAIEKGDMDVVDLVWKLGYAYDIQAFYYTAVSHKHEMIAEYLLEHDAPLDHDVLLHTIQMGYLKCVQTIYLRNSNLFDDKCMLTAVTYNQIAMMDFVYQIVPEVDMECFSVAVKEGFVEVLRKLCTWKTVNVYDMRDLQNEAIMYGHVPIIDYLLQFGSHFMLHSLNVAACHNDLDMVRFMYSKGVRLYLHTHFLRDLMSKPNCLDVLRVIHEEYHEPLTEGVLDAAIRYSTVDVVKFVHESGVPLTSSLWMEFLQTFDRDNTHFYEYLFDKACPWPIELFVEKACICGRLSLVKFAIKHQCPYSLNTCIELCKRHKRKKVLDFLLSLCPNSGNMLRKRLYRTC
jgi:hypothetical protein